MDDPVSQFKVWYNQQPKFTRTYLASAFILTILVSLSIVGTGMIYYELPFVIPGLQIWRPFTAILFQGKFGFNFLFGMWFAYFAMSRVQTDLFNRENYADFLWLCVYAFSLMTLIASLLPIYFTGDGFVFAFIYIWCKRRPFETIRFFFGLQVKSIFDNNVGGYFPWVLMGFRILMGGSVWGELAGLVVGHLYITVKDLYLPKYHKDYLATPRFLQGFINQLSKKWVYGRQGPVVPGEPRAGVFGGVGRRIG